MPKEIFNRVYDFDYFSGSQMFLYVGDVWVDEITSLSYEMRQNKTPIMGYASQLWDDCAAGHAMVSGRFSINYKEQGYLWAVLRRFHNMSGDSVGFETRGDKQLLKVRKGSRRDQPDLMRGGKRVGSNGTNLSKLSIERVTAGEVTRQERFDFYTSLAGYATFQVDSPKDRVFEDVVEAFEDQVWAPNATNDGLNSQIRRTDANEFDGFDMYVVFGNYDNPKANHTVQKIIDVRLLGQGKQIAIDGQPIQEVYDFIARTVA